MSTWLDKDPPKDPSLAKAYWCEMDYFLAHTAYGSHLPCRCPVGQGHKDPDLEEKRKRFLMPAPPLGPPRRTT